MKQEKELLAFLSGEYGSKQADEILKKTDLKLKDLLERAKDKSASQIRVLGDTILPRIALYQILLTRKGEAEAFETVRKYMLEVVSAKMQKRYKALEKIPGFFWVFRQGMAQVLKRSDAWQTAIIQNDRNGIVYHISRCLWFDACKENGCPHLCRVFCESDNIIYGGLRKVQFARNGTLVQGKPCCDFSFEKNK
ncbi:MAG: L-2-amino-thiazoline-4-carboxylic acid hydrolase [Erysipelotrichaceae bacterium]|jgi:hypothetical protein|nr:L-2-amino-thiazoline-4-carboxylic acid hydrolase [Erysipelotrichaceae bacterium]